MDSIQQPEYLRYEELIGTPFQIFLENFREKRRYNQNLISRGEPRSNEEADRKFPKQKCPLGDCSTLLSTAFSMHRHIKNIHPTYFKERREQYWLHKSSQQASNIQQSITNSLIIDEQNDLSSTDNHEIDQPLCCSELVDSNASIIDFSCQFDVNQEHSYARSSNEQPCCSDSVDSNTSIMDFSCQFDVNQEHSYARSSNEQPCCSDSVDSNTSIMDFSCRFNDNDDHSDTIFDETDFHISSDENEEDLKAIEELFSNSFNDEEEQITSSFYAKNVEVLPPEEKKLIDDFISEIIRTKVNKSIADKHAVAYGTIVAKYFIMARKKKLIVQNIMEKYCSSSYLQKQFLFQQKNHIKPITIIIPNLKIQYFSITKIIKNVIAQHPFLIAEILKEKDRMFIPEPQRNHFLIKNELDTTDYKLFQRLKAKLRIEIALDDFSFMGITGRKFLAGYMTISNLPFIERTQRGQIFMFLLAKRPVEPTTDVMNKILNPFVDEMKKLEINGLNFDGYNEKIYVTLSSVICDNLAQHEVLGLPLSFGKSSQCRDCFQKFENYANIRSHSIINSSGSDIDLFCHKYDFREPKPCVLTRLDGISRYNIMPPDYFHDLFEGCIKQIINLLIFPMIDNDEKNLSKIIVKTKLEEFPFYHGKVSIDFEKNDQIKLYGTGMLRGEAFMRLACVFFDEFNTFLTGREKQLYRDTIEFIRLTGQLEFDRLDLDRMKSLSRSIIDSYVSIVKDNSSKLSVTYKLHKLLHYADNILKFGPLFLSNSMRFERCHQTSKKYGRVMNCWVSPAKTLSNRMSMRQTLVLSQQIIDKKKWIKKTFITEQESINLNLEVANDQGDFLLGKNVIRRLKAPGFKPKVWIEGKEFLIQPDSKQLFLRGNIWLEERNQDKLSIYEKITFHKQNCIVNHLNFYHINDYIYKTNDNQAFVIRFH
ncbi:uncharacterized protein LOC142645634 [Dermatophagoides pteronyssinus]|uniref:uncharacterized protein LOC142645634 n=1 Tax=Dermatophagoides pteronyssinus TaxID=6956 RepID=UPI003F669906